MQKLKGQLIDDIFVVTMWISAAIESFWLLKICHAGKLAMSARLCKSNDERKILGKFCIAISDIDRRDFRKRFKNSQTQAKSFHF